MSAPSAASAQLVPQPHGGAIRQGGNPGNRGGGRPPSAVRRMARRLYAERLPVLAAIGDGAVQVPLLETCPKCGHEPNEAETRAALDRAPTPRDQVAAIKALGEVGLGKPVTLEDVRARLRLQNAILREMVPPEVQEALFTRLTREVWR